MKKIKVKYTGKILNLAVIGIGDFPIDKEVEIFENQWDQVKSFEGMKKSSPLIIKRVVKEVKK